MDAKSDELPRPIGSGLGTVREDFGSKYLYLDHLKTTISNSFKGLKVVLDCAHGAAYELAPVVQGAWS